LIEDYGGPLDIEQRRRMPPPYEVRVNLTRQEAHNLIIGLADDSELRAQFEADPYTMLREYGIDASPGTLPEQVTLPDPGAIHDFLDMAETRILSETASPLALLALFITIGAMPLLTRDRPAVDGSI
jgi:hypothetical protein